jgi:hypothetical protein
VRYASWFISAIRIICASGLAGDVMLNR